MRVRFVAAGIVIGFLGIGIASPLLMAKKPLTAMPLVWKPTTSLGELAVVDLTGLDGVQIRVEALKDSRSEKKLIGQNREEKVPLPVATPDDVGAWVTVRIRELLPRFGLETVETGGTVVVTGELLRFYVDETHTYEGDIGIKLVVKGLDNAVRWSGLVNGSESRFGRSYKAENYQEVLSDSLLNAVHSLLLNEAFRRALVNH